MFKQSCLSLKQTKGYMVFIRGSHREGKGFVHTSPVNGSRGGHKKFYKTHGARDGSPSATNSTSGALGTKLGGGLFGGRAPRAMHLKGMTEEEFDLQAYGHPNILNPSGGTDLSKSERASRSTTWRVHVAVSMPLLSLRELEPWASPEGGDTTTTTQPLKMPALWRAAIPSVHKLITDVTSAVPQHDDDGCVVGVTLTTNTTHVLLPPSSCSRGDVELIMKDLLRAHASNFFTPQQMLDESEMPPKIGNGLREKIIKGEKWIVPTKPRISHLNSRILAPTASKGARSSSSPSPSTTRKPLFPTTASSTLVPSLQIKSLKAATPDANKNAGGGSQEQGRPINKPMRGGLSYIINRYEQKGPLLGYGGGGGNNTSNSSAQPVDALKVQTSLMIPSDRLSKLIRMQSSSTAIHGKSSRSAAAANRRHQQQLRRAAATSLSTVDEQLAFSTLLHWHLRKHDPRKTPTAPRKAGTPSSTSYFVTTQSSGATNVTAPEHTVATPAAASPLSGVVDMIAVVRCLSANVHKQEVIEDDAPDASADHHEDGMGDKEGAGSATPPSPSQPAAVEYFIKDAVGLLAGSRGASSPTLGAAAGALGSAGVDPCFSLRDLCSAAVDNGDGDQSIITNNNNNGMSDTPQVAGLAVFRAMHNEVLDAGCRHLKSKFAFVPVQDGAKSLIRTFARYASGRLQHSPHPAPPIHTTTTTSSAQSRKVESL